MFNRAMPWFNLPIYFEGEGGSGGGVTPPAVDANAPWYQKAGVAQEHHEWLAAKEFADPSIAIASHRNLETMIGRNRLAVPANADDKDAYTAIYRTLGRPDNAEGYKLPEAVKLNADEWKLFAPIFHGAGLSQGQTEAITGAYYKRATEQAAAIEAERVAAETREVEKLSGEWASNAEANKDIASRAFRVLGLDEETTNKIEGAIGYYATMKLFHNIGKGLSESVMHQDTTRRGGADTGESKEVLQTKINNLLKDPEFKGRYNDPDPRKRKDAILEMEALQKKLADIIVKTAPQGAAA